jgi:tetraacyldisaccharide 4'-kinase
MKPDAIVITQKDRVKMGSDLSIWDFPVWALKIEICVVSGYEIFENKINAILN